jgi:hypothetical protein
LAALVEQVRAEAPAAMIRAHSDVGAGTGDDRGAGGGKSRAAAIFDELQAARDARPNPLAPPPAAAGTPAGGGPLDGPFANPATIDAAMGGPQLRLEQRLAKVEERLQGG